MGGAASGIAKGIGTAAEDIASGFFGTLGVTLDAAGLVPGQPKSNPNDSSKNGSLNRNTPASPNSHTGVPNASQHKNTSQTHQNAQQNASRSQPASQNQTKSTGTYTQNVTISGRTTPVLFCR